MMFDRLGYITAVSSLDSANVVIAGFPYDGTASYRSGSRFAPDEIRKASQWNLETYEPLLRSDLEDIVLADLGDLMPEIGGGPQKYLQQMRSALSTIPDDLPLLGLGGEHSITLPLFERAMQKNHDLGLVVIDAHTDLRDEYDGDPHSHACITRRIADLIGPERISMFGIRSGTREEFIFAEENQMLFDSDISGFQAGLDKLNNRPLYLSIDLDGFDPGIMPGTGTVEEGGLSWKNFVQFLNILSSRKIVSADVVELLPTADPTGHSTILAARICRILTLLMSKQ